MDDTVVVSQPFLAEQRIERCVERLRHIAGQLPGPVRLLVPGAEARSPERDLIAAAFERIGVSQVRFMDAEDGSRSSFEHLLGRHLSEALAAGTADNDARIDSEDEPDRAAAGHAAVAGLVPQRIEREPGVTLHAYAAGAPEAPPLVMVLPFGMPLALCAGWFESLSREYRVLSWETRGLFGACDDFKAVRADLDAQVDDLYAVMRHFGVASAQLMGICGGAVIAVAAAAREPARASALSLWYGDYPFADSTLRTPHQANFEWLMEAAAQSLDEARDLQQMFLDPGTLATTPPEIAHLSLYPYVNAELLHRYARINDALNKTDITPWFDQVRAPTLVVTGDRDTTTHAGGSALVARRIAGARLVVEPGGTHTDFFGMPAPSAELASAFHREHAVSPAGTAAAAARPGAAAPELRYGR
ncbi:alpha/beta fold hydrolase [Burkholderia gladioli]|uniref:alpha/beta fold hydrolase n=1 Tax=Burkholderia gladioli TaxID=28095 RepID=UPI001C24A9CF|nr:alpha/beta hydrolase [Burkholderia gladioli]MBU9172799.1 alpha/beta hydrolase [Burkholderia gladioli]